MDQEATITLSPCEHMITCAACTRALLQQRRPCPYCYEEIKDTNLVERSPEPWRTVS
jgi:pyrimidine deaminase RibD-like protein